MNDRVHRLWAMCMRYGYALGGNECELVGLTQEQHEATKGNSPLMFGELPVCIHNGEIVEGYIAGKYGMTVGCPYASTFPAIKIAQLEVKIYFFSQVNYISRKYLFLQGVKLCSVSRSREGQAASRSCSSRPAVYASVSAIRGACHTGREGPAKNARESALLFRRLPRIY